MLKHDKFPACLLRELNVSVHDADSLPESSSCLTSVRQHSEDVDATLEDLVTSYPCRV